MFPAAQKNQGNVCLLRLPTFMVLGILARVPDLAYGAIGPTSWSFKCMKAWGITSVHQAKMVLPISNLICCLAISFFLSIKTLLAGYRRDGTYVQCHSLLSSPAYHDLWNVTIPPEYAHMVPTCFSLLKYSFFTILLNQLRFLHLVSLLQYH